MARARSTWTTDQAREWGVKARAARLARRNSRAAGNPSTPVNQLASSPEALEPPSWPEELKTRTRGICRQLLSSLETLAAKERPDGAQLDRLASALERLAELERILDGRPGPGNRRPPREDPPSAAKPAPRPAFTHAGPAPRPGPPGPQPAASSTPTTPALLERPDF